MAVPGPIGVFDSGFGGLTVLGDFLRVLPQHDYLYLADAARVPYGDRSPDEILRYTEQSVRWMFAQGCGLVVLACNTATAYAVRPLQQATFPDRKILGVTIPAAEAVAAAGWKKVAVLATSKTVQDRTYGKRIALLDPDVDVQEVEAPGLVPLLESGALQDPARLREPQRLLDGYLSALRPGTQAVVLGCTHYHVFEEYVARATGLPVVHPGRESAAALVRYLRRHPEVDAGLSRGGSIRFRTTGDAAAFARLGPAFLGPALPGAWDTRHVDL